VSTLKRVRRSKTDAQRQILEAGEALLRQGGPEAVAMRAIAAIVGITDAAVSHHFGTRDELLHALLRHAGRRLKGELAAALAQWEGSNRSLDRLIDVIAGLYADGAYAELALRLHLSGWRDRGSGLLDPVVEVLQAERKAAFEAAGKPAPLLRDTQFVVGLIHQTLALDPLFGTPFRRSAGTTSVDEPSAAHKRKAWAAIFRAALFP